MECKVECNQDKEPESAFKHACVPTATCGSKLPAASYRSGAKESRTAREYFLTFRVQTKI